MIIRSVLNNNTAELGEAVFADGEATATVLSSRLAFNAANERGGGLYITGNASLNLAQSIVANNTAHAGAGAFASGTSGLTADGCKILGNRASVSGGGFGGDESAQLYINGSEFKLNAAGVYGGGVGVDGQASIALLQDSSIESNTAEWGAGVAFGEGQGASLEGSQQNIANNKGTYSPDISPPVAYLSVLGSSVVSGFASPLGSDASVLPVRLNVSGPFGLPCDGQLVQALLNGTQVLGVNRSDSAGMLLMRLNIRQQPGLYHIVLDLVPGVGQQPVTTLQPANLSLQVRGCIVGEVTPAPDACQACPERSFSLNPSSRLCDSCPPGAQCPGGFAIVPLPGMWHSAPQSPQLHM
jgi:hypothetical protein